MNIVVTSEGNGSTFGDLFFSLPVQEARTAAAQEVADLCRKALPAGEGYAQRLEAELKRMEETQSAYYFLLLQAVNEAAEGRFTMLGSGAASLISMLLGLTQVDPMDVSLVAEHLDTPLEFVWGAEGETRLPDLSAAIDPSVRGLLQRYLDRCYGMVYSDEELYCRISLVDWDCGWQRNHFVPDNCLQVLHKVAQEREARALELLQEESITKEDYRNLVTLTDEMHAMTSCDLPMLIRLEGYTRGSFLGEMHVADLQNPWFFTTREEFYAALRTLGMPSGDALVLVKRGVWSEGSKRERYVELLKEYGAPRPLLEQFARMQNLWLSSSIRNRLQWM